MYVPVAYHSGTVRNTVSVSIYIYTNCTCCIFLRTPRQTEPELTRRNISRLEGAEKPSHGTIILNQPYTNQYVMWWPKRYIKMILYCESRVVVSRRKIIKYYTVIV